MESEVFIFEHPKFGKIRGLVINGEPKFVGNDVATSLGYKDTVNALKTHVPEKFKCVINAKILKQMASESKGGDSPLFDFDSPRGLTFINEAGLYKLILRSKLPAAEEFSDWVCEEVLPSIRKTGSYSLTAAPAPAVKPDLARVYLLLLSDGTVQILKIGQSKNVRARVAKIERETGLNVVDIYFTPYMPREIARLVEWTSQKKLSAWHVKGEFFSVEFEEARKVVDYSVEIAFAKLPGTFGREKNFLQAADK